MPITADEFAAYMAQLQELLAGSRIAVAVSGGPDSLCLAYLLQQWCQPQAITLSTLIVDHRLRAESTLEAETTAQQLRLLGLSVEILTWHGHKPTTRIQESAREARYDLLISWCQSHNYTHLFVAHHAQDQQETALWRLMRGSDLWGLAGMSAQSRRKGIYVCRPLLRVSKERLLATLQATSLMAVSDRSNTDDQYARVRVRKRLSVLPALPVNQLGRLRRNFDLWLKAYIDQYVSVSPYGYVTLRSSSFYQLTKPFWEYLIIHFLKVMTLQPYPPRRQDMVNLIAHMHNPRFKSCTLGGCAVLRHRQHIIIGREWKAMPVTAIQLQSSAQTIVWDKNFQLTLAGIDANIVSENNNFEVRSLGKQGWQQLCSARHNQVLKDIPYAIRLSLPSLWIKDKVIDVVHMLLSGRQSVIKDIQFMPNIIPEPFVVLND